MVTVTVTVMIMILHSYSAFSFKGSNALYNESQGNEIGHQAVKAPMTAAIGPYMISSHHPVIETGETGETGQTQHRGLRPLLFSMSDEGSLTPPTYLVFRGVGDKTNRLTSPPHDANI